MVTAQTGHSREIFPRERRCIALGEWRASFDSPRNRFIRSALLHFGRATRFLSGAAFALTFAGCDSSPVDLPLMEVGGETMGTTYIVKVVSPPPALTEQRLGSMVATALSEVNQRLSNWISDSEVSRFNASASTMPVPISTDFLNVMTESFEIHRATGGRFDVTVAPLINLWGFGPRDENAPIPSQGAVNTALEQVGMARHLSLDSKGLRKLRPDVSVNLSAIAKGYGVDRVAQALVLAGVENYLVEIGGDLATQGHNAAGAPWRVGIEKPQAHGREIQLVVSVSGLGMATSGDYRNFVMHEGKRFSHIIDPVTGRPITHGLASVTVLAETGTRADGWATALLVMGDTAGLKVADSLGIAAYFIVRQDDGFVTMRSKAFDERLKSSADVQ